MLCLLYTEKNNTVLYYFTLSLAKILGTVHINIDLLVSKSRQNECVVWVNSSDSELSK